jgi:hypothetical protein
MKKFLQGMGFVNWLAVAVAFQLDGSQTWTMCWVFLSMIMALLIIMVTMTINKHKQGMVFKDNPTIPKLVISNMVDVSFWVGVAYIIQNDLPFNIVMLMVLVRVILFTTTISSKFVQG